MQKDRDEVPSVPRRPEPGTASALRSRIVVDGLLESELSERLMPEGPHQVAPAGIAGKQARAWDEHVECQRAARSQVPGHGSKAVANVVAVLQVKERVARDQDELEPVIQ